MKLKSLFLYGEPVTITDTTITGHDDYDDPIVTTTSVTVKGAFALTDTVEGTEPGTHRVIDQPNVLLPPTAAVTSASTITVRDVDYQVLGTPQVWRSPFTGREHGIKVLLFTSAG